VRKEDRVKISQSGEGRRRMVGFMDKTREIRSLKRKRGVLGQIGFRGERCEPAQKIAQMGQAGGKVILSKEERAANEVPITSKKAPRPP